MYKKALISIVLPLIGMAAQWQALNGPLTGLAEDMSIGWHEGMQQWITYAADALYYPYASTNEGVYWDSIYWEEEIANPTHGS